MGSSALELFRAALCKDQTNTSAMLSAGHWTPLWDWDQTQSPWSKWGPLLPSEPPSSPGGCISPTPCLRSPRDSKARRISHLAGDPAAAQSRQKLPPGPAALTGADGGDLELPGGYWPRHGVAAKTQSCISEVRGCKEDPRPLENTLRPGRMGQGWPRTRSGSSVETFPFPIQLS